jgi:translation initiation factor 2B subunit (eIF-2B alpha/beta/delta family)
MGFAADRRSGSGDVAHTFLDELERWVAIDTSTTVPALRAALLGWLRAAQAAQPSLALIHQLAARALEVANAGIAREDTVSLLRNHLVQSCAAERSDLDAARAAIAAMASRLVTERQSWIATVSHSGAVREALIHAQRSGLRPRALVAESRPLLEGRGLAAKLAAADIPVWLVVDAALPLLLSQAHMVWIGADAVTDRGVLNKVGSYAVALAAREHSVPLYALAERRKFLPATTGSLRIAEMPPEEVWDQPVRGMQARNIYFELVPMELLRGVVVDDRVLGPSEAAAIAREHELPEELAKG